MSASVVIGSQWGDEGKAKVIDYLTERSDVIIRFHGGANAGHTVIADGKKFVFHMVPSGIMYPEKVCVVGNGVVFDAEQFLAEIDDLTKKGISADGRVFVSDLAHMVLPYHKSLDNASENAMGAKKIGTTGRGIGPAYADKATRSGIRTGDLVKWEVFTAKFMENFAAKKQLIEKIYQAPFTLDADAILTQYRAIRDRLVPMIADTARYLYTTSKSGRKLLFEGAQGTFLDIDHGTYPYVTSSNTVAGAVCTGAGVGPSLIGNVIGIVKAYTTRVGNGPFPTELTDAIGDEIQKLGGEFGATTGRPRRCGWFDSVMLRKAIQLNGMTHMALTKLDVLNTFTSLKICTHYQIDGKTVEDFPTSLEDLARATPVFATMNGWKKSLEYARTFNDLPQEAQAYIKRLQSLCYDLPVLMVSVGPDRKQTIEVTPIG